MNGAESMKEYIARAKSLALNIKYHDIEVTDQEISRRVLNGLPPLYAPEKRNFALKTDFSLAELEGGLVRVEELNRSSDGTDGNHALAAGFKARNGGWSGGRGGHNGGGRGKRDGKGRPPHQRNSSNINRNISRRFNSSSISRSTSESSSPRISSNNGNISSGTSNISHRSRSSSTRGTSRAISRNSSIQRDGVHHAFVSGVVNTGIFCRSAVQYPPRVVPT